MVVGSCDIVEEACLSKLEYLYKVVKESWDIMNGTFWYWLF